MRQESKEEEEEFRFKGRKKKRHLGNARGQPDRYGGSQKVGHTK